MQMAYEYTQLCAGDMNQRMTFLPINFSALLPICCPFWRKCGGLVVQVLYDSVAIALLSFAR